MCVRKLRLPLIVFAAIVLTANLAWALGFELGETKEQLRLKYDLSVKDHGTGRITVTLTIADHGRLKPLNSVDLVVPAKDGTNFVDLSVSLATREVDGKQMVHVHLIREMAERARIHLTTSSLDGKKDPLTWYFHAIPIAKYLKIGSLGQAPVDDAPTPPASQAGFSEHDRLLEFVTIPSRALPEGVQLVRRVASAPLAPFTRNPAVVVILIMTKMLDATGDRAAS